MSLVDKVTERNACFEDCSTALIYFSRILNSVLAYIRYVELLSVCPLYGQQQP